MADANGAQRDSSRLGHHTCGIAPGVSVLTGDEKELARLYETHHRQTIAVEILDLGMRERGAGPRARDVHSDVVRWDQLRRPVADDGPRLVRLTVLDAVLAKLHRLRRDRGQRPAAMRSVPRRVSERASQAGQARFGVLPTHQAHRLAHDYVVHAVLHRPLNVARGDRSAFRLVGGEQLLAGMPGEHRGHFPAQVVRVVHGAVEPEPTGGWMAMRGIADKEDETDLEAIRQEALERRAPNHVAH